LERANLKAIEKNVLLDERIIERQVKTFLDIVILAMLNGRSMHGYKILATIRRELGILLNPAFLYSQLHLLEENKLIEPTFGKGKTIYYLTPKGKAIFKKKSTPITYLFK
jgi:DNA-binding PadR family transcriptional regulator